MKSNELRVGNLVYRESYGHFEWEPKSFQDFGFGFELSEISDKIEPIPLTTEILEKYHIEVLNDTPNFKKNYLYFDKEDGYEYVIADFSHDGMETVPVKYLHQLQNLHFALTGEELI